MSRRLPTLWRWRRAWAYREERLRAAVRSALFAPYERAFAPPRGLLAWLIPGLAQMQRGARERGWAFLGLYAATMLLALVLQGTLLGALMLGAAVTVHVTGVVEAATTRHAAFRDRLLLSVLVMAGLGCLVYLPTIWAVSRVARSVRLEAEAEPFSAGDVVWYSPLARPGVGDWVLYRAPQFSYAGRTAVGQNAVFQVRGDRINRVVARGGQKVAVRQGRLFVDGVGSRWQPITRTVTMTEAEWTIPDGSVFVLPENLMPEGTPLPTELFVPSGIVPLANLEGVVYFRTFPLNRVGLVR